MDSTIIFLSILLIVLSIMLVFKIKINLDILTNNCNIKIYLFFIRIVKIDINLIGLTFQINNNKNKKNIKLFLTKEEEYLIKQIKKTIIDKVYYDDIVIDYLLGLNTPSVTALSVGVINAILNCIKQKLLTINNDTNILIASNADFDGVNFKLNMQIKFYFTLFDLLFALVLSFYKRGVYVKQRKQHR